MITNLWLIQWLAPIIRIYLLIVYYSVYEVIKCVTTYCLWLHWWLWTCLRLVVITLHRIPKIFWMYDLLLVCIRIFLVFRVHWDCYILHMTSCIYTLVAGIPEKRKYVWLVLSATLTYAHSNFIPCKNIFWKCKDKTSTPWWSKWI